MAKTLELDPDALAALAELHLEQHRPDEAAAIYAQLATAHRTRTDYAARAHFARGIALLDSGAHTEARHELRRALAALPSLEAARDALESMATTRIRPLEKPGD